MKNKIILALTKIFKFWSLKVCLDRNCCVEVKEESKLGVI